MEVVTDLAERVIVLQFGQKIADGLAKKTIGYLARVYLG